MDTRESLPDASKKPCDVAGCDRTIRTLGLCRSHGWHIKKFGYPGDPQTRWLRKSRKPGTDPER